MRKILFRGKRINNSEWAYGNLIITERLIGTECYISSQTGIDNGKSFKFSVDPLTVGQFTGLTDKNGKKIFEGDILKICYDSPLFDGYGTECICYNGIVKYENALFVCEENSKRSDALCALSSNEFEVIGNIHDNPELLEVSE